MFREHTIGLYLSRILIHIPLLAYVMANYICFSHRYFIFDKYFANYLHYYSILHKYALLHHDLLHHVEGSIRNVALYPGLPKRISTGCQSSCLKPKVSSMSCIHLRIGHSMPLSLQETHPHYCSF